MDNAIFFHSTCQLYSSPVDVTYHQCTPPNPTVVSHKGIYNLSLLETKTDLTLARPASQGIQGIQLERLPELAERVVVGVVVRMYPVAVWIEFLCQEMFQINSLDGETFIVKIPPEDI